MTQKLEALPSVISKTALTELYHDIHHGLDEAQRLYNNGILDLKQRAYIEDIYYTCCRSIRDKLDPSAKLSNSVNTVQFANISIGHNTDGPGFANSLKQQSVNVAGKNVLLLGAGGASRSIAAQLVIDKAKLTIANRSDKYS